MLSSSSRACSAVLALIVVALAACKEQPQYPTDIAPRSRASLSVGEVLLVSNTSGGNVAGSLRALVSQATGGEVIRFDQSLAGKTITLDTTLEVQSRVTIEAPADKGITISGGGKATVLHVHKGATLVNVTITGGKSSGNSLAGGILSSGPLVLDHSTVSGNQGIDGGGIRGDTITLVNSTIANNSTPATSVAAGINFDFHGALTLINSTVAFNTGGTGIGPFGSSSFTPKVTIRNSIIAKNERSSCFGGNDGFVFEGKNILSDDSCGRGVLVILITDPLLVALADNGGPTQTLALDRNSPAIDATDCDVGVDQRYVARGASCDIGAFEFVFTSVNVTVDSRPEVDPKTGAALLTGTVRCSRTESFDLAVSLTQEQKVKRAPTLVQATRTLPVACGPVAQPWIVSIAPATGEAFVNGDARASVQTLNIAKGVIPVADSTNVQLFWAKK